MLACNQEVQQYLDSLTNEVKKQYDIATAARVQNKDPEPHVDIFLARTVAERTEALIASVAPQVLNSGIAQRIVALEKKYGPGDWRTALIIGEEVASEKFCKFRDLREALEVGIRIGFAYITNGVTSSPLEGLVEIKFKKRKDNKDYVALYFSGPIRNSGGTAATVSVIIADYLRKKFGIADYDITDEEVKRYQVEIDDYVTKVAHRQYVPAASEIAMIVRNIKVEITGDPTEKYEVSQCKHLERVETDLIRGGMALVMTEGPSLKAEKLWKQISKWGSEFGLEHWFWLKDFIVLKTNLHTKSEKGAGLETMPINTYLSDIVAGRPVFSYPMRTGGFRLRYGRSRLSGFASTAIHPATAQVLDNYVATGTQIKTERPGKASTVAFCDSIEGPIVKLKNGSVLRFDDEKEARATRSQIDEILFLGDILISYGDFSENGARLVPCGYNEDWWAAEFEKAAGKKSEHPKTAAEAVSISEKYQIPLHPRWTYHWKSLNPEQFTQLQGWMKKLHENTISFELEPKKSLELIGCPHTVVNSAIVFSDDDTFILKYLFKGNDGKPEGKNGLELVRSISKIKIRDKSGTFIGTRMGRPEKAKLRALKGSPAALFPVGREGGRLRSMQSALEKGSVFADFPILHCPKCDEITVYQSCPKCGTVTAQWRICPLCKKKTKQAKCHIATVAYEKRKLSPKEYYDFACQQLKISQPPAQLKAVRGTWNKDHVLENMSKGILRALNGLTVNKDGTIRYDMTELGATHFKPAEIETSVERLRQLGYVSDRYGRPLENENQIVEIFPQDVILPACPEAADEGADKIMLRICEFIDCLLESFYNLPRFFNAKTRQDLVGHLIIGLAPHTSCGIVGRIIGFSKTQTCLAHPYWHAAQRRNFDGDENGIILMLDAFLNFSRRFLPDRRGGRTMDAPLVLSTVLDPNEVDTEVHGMDIAEFYPLELYEFAENCAWPWEVKVEQVKHRLGTEAQYCGLKYTHEVSSINAGVIYSAYKAIPTMLEKMAGQLELARKIKAVDFEDVVRLVVDKHFLRDIKGNLRGFTQQEFRCVECNLKYRRAPLHGTCTCGGKLLFTISEGNIRKYLDASLKLVSLPGISPYMKQSLELLKRRIESIFGREATKQIELKSWFG